MLSEQNISSSDIAIIGMNGRFPGAAGLEQFWCNLCDGREGIRLLSDQELLCHGVDSQTLSTSDYVKAVADVGGVEFFDNGFFGFTPRDAELMDPQLRILLECAWATIEHAGYNVDTYRGAIGMYAGAAPNTYFIENLVPDRELMRALSGPLSSLAIFTASDALSTMVSFKLNLRGPSISVQTACSTSLVAVHLACQSLLARECDMALAGGVNLTIPQERGYLYQKGMILSPDGHCRPFDEDAAGTIFGGGVGLVFLKRLADALDDKDHIYAVIKGSAINNDGSTKAGFTAPSVIGQSGAIADALAIADVPADSVSYVEAHGTGTALGDPIEVEALTRAFRLSTDRNSYCGIGSVKSNIGHLDRAAGIASLIKTVLSFEYGQIPPTLHFKRPNPNIDFQITPFYVVDKLTEWKSGPGPRRAVVNSVGFGGTNSCAVLEEPPSPRPSGKSRPYQLLSLSARTESALDEATRNLGEYFKRQPDSSLADAAYTLHIGRQPFDCRRVAVCRDLAEAITTFTSLEPSGLFSGRRLATVPSVVFMFPGQGTQYAGMGAELYRSEPCFRAEVDRCLKVLQPNLKNDLQALVFPDPKTKETAGQQLIQSRYAQPALFIIEYALAKLWMSWGIKPMAMIGHSVGEYVAACLAEVFSLEDALSLVAERANLVQAQPPGSMLSIRLPEKEVIPFLNADLAIAAVNSPVLCVVSGPDKAIGDLEGRLVSRGVMTQRLQASHAFHSPMMAPVVAPFTTRLGRVKFSAPKIPCVSNVTGVWITAEQATSPSYWAGQVRQTVRFAEGLTALFGDGPRLFLEVGPGQTLSQMVRQHHEKRSDSVVLASLSASPETSGDSQPLLEALGKAWITGISVDWQAFYSHEERNRIPLPTYPFERKKLWLETPGVIAPVTAVAEASVENCSIKQDCGGSPLSRSASGQAVDLDPKLPSRTAHMEVRIRHLLQELSGLQLSGVEASATFLEMGLDSLFLAQFSRRIEKEFGVPVNFDQLAGELATSSALAGYLDRVLPHHLMTDGGHKIDGQRLVAESNSASRIVPIEDRLWKILVELSGIRQSDLTDSATFLEMGFDSLFLAEFSRKLETEFQVSMNFGQLADANVKDLACHLDGIVPSNQTPHEPIKLENSAEMAVTNNVIAQLQEQVRLLTEQVETLRRTHATSLRQDETSVHLSSTFATDESGRVVLPITAAQQEIWLASKMGDNASRAYNEVVVLRLQGALHIRILEQSIQDLVDRHDSLRITIAADGKQQFIHPQRRQELPLTDLSTMARFEREASLQEIIDRHNRNLFDLEKGPLMSAQLVRLDDDQHVLLLAFHHVVIDGWSTHVIVSDLSRLYSAKIKGGTDVLISSMQYRDYIKWYHDIDAIKKRRQDEEYWVKSFEDRPASVELPSKGPRPLCRSYRAGNANITFDRDLYRRFKKFSAKSSCTLFHFLLATFAVWVRRITGQHDIVIGVPLAGQLAQNLQHSAGCDRLVGHCANVVPIRSEVRDGNAFVDFLTDVKGKVLEARAHESFTYGELIERLNPARDSSRVPLVSVTVNLNDEPEINWDQLNVAVEVPPLSCIFFDLEINMWESESGLRIACYFADDLFDSGMVTNWLLQWKRLMISASESPASRLDELELLDTTERNRLLNEWNKTAAEFPDGSTLSSLIEAQAARTPRAVAVVAGAETLSYEQLNAAANRLARGLRRRGIGPESRVGVFLERTAAMPVALLGILKAGAAYVPLDPIYPAERIAYVLEDAEAALLLTQQSLLSALGATSTPVFCVDRDEQELAEEASENLTLASDATVPAYVIYTSGSTGKPKGVQIEHRALVNFLHSMQHEPGVTAADRLLAVTTLSFDIAGLELFLPLISGARVILVPWQTTADGRALMRTIEEQEVTVMQATPATWRLLVEAGWAGRPGLKILCGGEPLPADLARQLLPRCAELWNMYGPTETTIWSTCCRVQDASTIHIGRPINNTELYILDEQQRPVPVGVAGELLIGGVGLARGYFKRPDLTAEKFIAHPFKPGERLYRTGDLARYRPDGNVDCLGRLDFQVKIRGFRIELGEIEACLARHPAIKQCIVVAQQDVQCNKLLAAYFELYPGRNVSIADLRSFLKKVLPDYMLPAAFVLMERLPLTPNGKIDRKALPDVEGRRIEAQGDYLAPRDPLEQAIAEIWSKILRVKKVGLRDNFFESGGNSLSAVSMLLEVQEVTGKQLPLLLLLEDPTIEGLATILRSERSGPSSIADEQDACLRAKLGPLVERPMNSPHIMGQNESNGKANIIVREARFDEKDLAAIWPLLRQAFPVPYTACTLAECIKMLKHRWLENPARTCDHVFGWVLESPTDGIVGFVGQVPVRIKVGEREIVGASGTSFCVLPAYQSYSLMLLRHLMDWGDRHFLITTTANQISAQVNQGFGMNMVQSTSFAPQLFWLFRPEVVVKWRLAQLESKVWHRLAENFPGAILLKGIARAGFRRHQRLNFKCPKLSVKPVVSFTEEFDELWYKNKNDYGITTIRDRAFLTWRHLQDSGILGKTFVFACRDDGKLRGYIALLVLSGEVGCIQDLCMVTDLLYERVRRDVLHNLMNHAFEFARANGCSGFAVMGYANEVIEELKTQRPYIRRSRTRGYWYKDPTQAMARLSEKETWWPSGVDGDSYL